MSDEAIRVLALALHEWEHGPTGGELLCFSCARWPDENTPDRQPAPGDICWESASDILSAVPEGWRLVDETGDQDRLDGAALRRLREAMPTPWDGEGTYVTWYLELQANDERDGWIVTVYREPPGDYRTAEGPTIAEAADRCREALESHSGTG